MAYIYAIRIKAGNKFRLLDSRFKTYTAAKDAHEYGGKCPTCGRDSIPTVRIEVQDEKSPLELCPRDVVETVDIDGDEQ